MALASKRTLIVIGLLFLVAMIVLMGAGRLVFQAPPAVGFTNLAAIPATSESGELLPGDLPFVPYSETQAIEALAARNAASVNQNDAPASPSTAPVAVASVSPPSAPQLSSSPSRDPFAVRGPIILSDGREWPTGLPIGEARFGGVTLPVYYSAVRFYRPSDGRSLDAGAQLRRIGDYEVRDFAVSGGALPTTQERVAALEEMRSKGYAPALLLPGGERVIPTGELNVVPQPSVRAEDFVAAVRRLGFTVIREATAENEWWLLGTLSRRSEDVLRAANAIAQAVPCRFAEPNWFREVRRRYVPNDPLFPRQWHLRNTGQTSGTIGADIKADSAWNVTSGRPEVIIAVFDDGFDIGHTDLPPATTLYMPRDFVRNTATPTPADVDPEDPDNHGTPVWGLIAAPHGNSRGVAGVAPGVRWMLLRNPIEMSERATADAIRYAGANGAHIMSNSWGYSNPSSVVTSAISWARTSGRGGKGTLLMFASGNENADIGVTNDLSNNINLLAIGATTHQDRRTTYSNYGARLFAVAPAGYGEGVGLVATDRTGAKGYTGTSYTEVAGGQFDGTSGACPIAAGIAGLVFSIYPDFTADQVKAILLESADKVQPGTAGYDANGHSAKYGYGRLNAWRAVDRARVVAGQPGTGGTPVDPPSGTGSTTVVFQENFESLTAGTTSRSGKWSLARTGATGSVFEVALVSGNKFLRALNLQGTATWKTAAIGIAGLTNVGVRLKFAEVGTLETSDVLEAWYQIDARAPVRFFLQADDASSTFTEAAVAGLSGNTITVWVTFNNGASEEWRLDDVVIAGTGGSSTPTPPPSTSGAILYREDFEQSADGAVSSTGRWTLASPGALGATFAVGTVSGNKLLRAINVQGLAMWKSAPIAIGGQSKVSIRLKLAEIGTLEASDTIQGWYSVDGKTPVRWFMHADDFGSTLVETSVTGISGSSLTVWVNLTNGASEEWRIDDIEIAGAPSTASTRGAGAVLFRENFENTAEGAREVAGEWRTDSPGSSGRLQAARASTRRFLTGTALEGGGTWRSRAIPIAGHPRVTARLRLSEIGVMEPGDWIRAFYRVDDGPLVLWFQHTGQIPIGAKGVDRDLPGLSGKTLHLVFEFSNNGQDEAWRIDNLEVIAGR